MTSLFLTSLKYVLDLVILLRTLISLCNHFLNTLHNLSSIFGNILAFHPPKYVLMFPKYIISQKIFTQL